LKNTKSATQSTQQIQMTKIQIAVNKKQENRSTIAAGRKTMTVQKLSKEKGFSLVEMMVAVCIMAIAFAGLATMEIACINGNSIASNVTMGITLAQDKMEELNSVDYNDPRVADVNTGSEGSGGTWKLAVLASTVRRRVVSRLWKTNPVVPVTAARAAAAPVFFRKSLRSISPRSLD